MADLLPQWQAKAAILAANERTLRAMAEQHRTDRLSSAAQALDDVADDLAAARQTLEDSIRHAQANPAQAARRADLFGAYPSAYSPPNVQTAADGKLRSWHRAVDACLVYEHGDVAALHRRDAWAAVLLRVRYLVTDCGEDATDPVAVNLCLDVIRMVTSMKLTSPI